MSVNTTLKQQAYAIIQQKLLSGDLRAGDLVSELALAQEIGMSRTPVREAIGQLEIEGLFDKVPRSGTIVRLPDKAELGELYQVREALESHAMTVAVDVLGAADFAEMERLQCELAALIPDMRARGLTVLDESLLHRFFEADIGFHTLMVQATGNRRTEQIINEFRVVQRVFEYDRMDYDEALVESAAREHGEILSALERGDGEAARVAMAAHIRSSCGHAMESLDRRALEKSDDAQHASPGQRPRFRDMRMRKNARSLPA